MQSQGGLTAVSFARVASVSEQIVLPRSPGQRRLAPHKKELTIIKIILVVRWLPFLSGPQLPMSSRAPPGQPKPRAKLPVRPGKESGDSQIARLPANAMKHPRDEPPWE